MKRILIIALGFGVSFSVHGETPLLALSQVEGVVLVNQGQKFTRARNEMVLTAGDRLLTMKESQVALRSEQHGCRSLVGEHSLLTVPPSLDCTDLARLQETGTLYAALGDEPGAEPQGSGEATPPTNNPNPPNNPNPRGGWLTPTESLFVGFGAVFAGAGVAAGLAATEDTERATPDRP